MKKVWRDVLILIAFTASVLIIVFLLVQFTPVPPVTEMEQARDALSVARKNKADTYSRKLFNEAKSCYDSAMANWKKQNEKFLYFRDYDKVLTFASLSAKKASQAAEHSLSNTNNLKIKIGQKIDTLNSLVVKIDKLFTTYPLPSETRNRISKGKMLLQEAAITYSKGEYLQANRNITDSEYLLISSYESAEENLKNYFRSFSVWKNWTDKTIKDSRINGDYSIIIDKFSRKLYVYQKGTVKWQFDAELGKNWVGDKRVRGDNATPEGMYRIKNKFDSRKTKYHKALLLDYPNAEDLARFKAEIARGTLPASARIGGLIEIHGNGGKGIDWTEGCIALTDEEMDVVFKITRIGTPVTIIGSMVDLRQIMNQ
jgi:hypothetical protein